MIGSLRHEKSVVATHCAAALGWAAKDTGVPRSSVGCLPREFEQKSVGLMAEFSPDGSR